MSKEKNGLKESFKVKVIVHLIDGVFENYISYYDTKFS